jgi:RNA recognition motif. (a.k.a. RRM, RBD, or RNP domain)
MSNNGTQEHNRNRNNNPNRNRNRNRGPQGGQQGGSPRSHNPNQKPQSQHEKFVSRTPVKLTLWQKLKKMLGLYKEPETSRPQTQKSGPRPSNSPTPYKTNTPQQREPRSNTRDVRKDAPQQREPREPREARPPRERKPAPVGDVESTRLYLGNLSYETTESDLEELFKGVGPVRSVEVVYNKHTHRSKGYGFVEMLRIDEAKRAVEVLHDQPFMGRNLVVSGAKAKEDMPRENSRDEQPKAEAPATSEAAPETEPVTEAAPEVTPVAESEPVEEVHTFSAEEAKKETFV